MRTDKQKERVRGRRATGWAFFPYLFAVFPVVSILSSNAGKVPLYLAVNPVLIALALTASADLLLRPILSDAHKRGIVLLLAVALFWRFDAMVDAVHLAHCVCLILGIGLGEDGLSYRADSDVMARHGLHEQDLEEVGLETVSELGRIENLFAESGHAPPEAQAEETQERIDVG